MLTQKIFRESCIEKELNPLLIDQAAEHYLKMEPFLVLPPSEKFEKIVESQQSAPSGKSQSNLPKPGIIIEEIRTIKQEHTNEISYHPDHHVASP